MAEVDSEGGDAACWLDHVCDRCGRFVEDDRDHQCTEPVSPPAN